MNTLIRYNSIFEVLAAIYCDADKYTDHTPVEELIFLLDVIYAKRYLMPRHSIQSFISSGLQCTSRVRNTDLTSLTIIFTENFPTRGKKNKFFLKLQM